MNDIQTIQTAMCIGGLVLGCFAVAVAIFQPVLMPTAVMTALFGFGTGACMFFARRES